MLGGMILQHVAVRKFFVSVPGTETIHNYDPGDVIPDFLDWADNQQRIHLAQQIVKEKWVPDEGSNASGDIPRRSKSRAAP